VATIGTFKLDPNGSYTGTVITLAFKARVRIIPNPDKSADNQPDYRVYSQGSVETGAAWKKTSDQGRPYLSVSLDDPSFAAPLNAALVASEGEDGSFVLAWTRPRRNAG
jgi:uncharacterized protein (DUF736 family)